MFQRRVRRRNRRALATRGSNSASSGPIPQPTAGAASLSLDATRLHYEFGCSGSVAVSVDLAPDGAMLSPTHALPQSGVYTIVLGSRDALGPRK